MAAYCMKTRQCTKLRQTFSVTKGPFFVFPACESSGRKRKTKAQIAKLTTITIFIMVKVRKVIQSRKYSS